MGALALALALEIAIRAKIIMAFITAFNIHNMNVMYIEYNTK